MYVFTVKAGSFQIKVYYIIPLKTVAGFFFEIGNSIRAIYNEHS